MPLRTPGPSALFPDGQLRQQYQPHWGVYDHVGVLPNTLGNVLSTNQFELEAGDIAYSTQDTLLYTCVDPGTAGGGDAVWSTCCTGPVYPTYVVGPFSDANYFQSIAGTAPTWAQFTWRVVLKLIARPTVTTEYVFSTFDAAATVGYAIFLNANGFNFIAHTSLGGIQFAPTFLLNNGDNGHTFVLHVVADGTKLRLYVQGAQVGTGTAILGALDAPTAACAITVGNYVSLGFPGAGESVANIVGTSTVMTDGQIAADAAAIMSRTQYLAFPTLPGELPNGPRYNARDLLFTADWHDQDADDLTLVKHGAPTVALL